MDNTGKIRLVRPGWPDKYVTEGELKRVDYLAFGWKVADQSAPSANSEDEVRSTNFGANPAGVKKCTQALEGKSASEIAKAFDGDERPKMIELRDKLLAALEQGTTGDQENDPEKPTPILSINFDESEEGIEALKDALVGKPQEEIAAVFADETRDAMIQLYTELTK